MNWTDEQRELTARNLSREVRWWNWDHPSFEGERQRWLAEADEFLADLAAVSAGPEPAKRFSEDDLQGLRDDLYSEVGQATGYISDHDDDTVDWKTQFTDTLMLHFERFLRDFAGAGPAPKYQWATQVGGLIMPARDEREARSLLSGKPKRRTVGEWEDVPDAE